MPNVVSCRACGAIVLPLESAGVCPQCHAPVDDGDETRLAPPAPIAPGAADPSASSSSSSKSSLPSSGHRGTSRSSGWLSSSGAIDHGRFEPGTLLGGRYRVVQRLGRGGMGEVYRADDLKLGQQVALKFLPADVDTDPARLMQLHTEVRMARLVSHPNVCRVFDIDEMDGQTFLSMEYIDGEDLSSLLRRIGRFPEDRALEITRQICAGLAAAHERGVIHRDFKPANVMLDATGTARITDFGLAGVSGEALRAGTPAYMAPEQLAGGEVTARSDIYALGLVLYEVFTGQRALDAKNVAELIHKREQGIRPPSALVKDLNPAVEDAILRCLVTDADARPASALLVAAILPGGDPLAAALAAGETPSPEMVAAAGTHEAVSLRAALAGAVWIALTLVALTFLYQRVMLINRIPTPKSPEALIDRTRDALSQLGYDAGYDSASGLGFSLDYANFIGGTSDSLDRWTRLRAGRPETLVAWHRTSPRTLVPLGTENNVTSANPPHRVSGMTLLAVDASGRLAEFHAVPPPVHQATESPAADWTLLFEAAALPPAAFHEVAPTLLPLVYADERKAWEGTLPEQPDHPFRVEAAALGGKPVYFVVSGLWSRSSRGAPTPAPLFNLIITTLSTVIMTALMLAGVVLSRRNLTLGRGDRQGAFRAAAVLFTLSMIGWVLGASHVGALGEDTTRLFGAIGRALFRAGLLWLTYLGLEPYVRRVAPDSLIGWTRLIGGQWRDPRVATDALIGVSAGLAMTLLYAVHNVLPPLAGLPEPMPLVGSDRVLMGARFALAAIVDQTTNAFLQSMLAVVGIVALLMLVKKRWLAGALGVVLFTPAVVSGMFSAGTPRLDLAVGAAIISVLILVVLRFGLLASVAALATHFVLLRAPLTTELGSWRGPIALWYLLVVAAFGLGACYIARSATSGLGARGSGLGARALRQAR